MPTQCHSRLYPPLRDHEFGYRVNVGPRRKLTEGVYRSESLCVKGIGGTGTVYSCVHHGKVVGLQNQPTPKNVKNNYDIFSLGISLVFRPPRIRF
jgi:hypothetical protein